MNWDAVMSSVDGSLAGVFVVVVAWALVTDRIYLRREMTEQKEQNKEKRAELADERTKRLDAERMIFDLTNELREHSRTDDKVIEVLLSSKGNSHGSNQT